MAKRTQARNRRRQARELNQIDAIERRLERSAMPKIRKELNVIARDALSAYRVGGQRNAEVAIDGGQYRISDTLEQVYKTAIKKTEKILKEHYPKDIEKVKQVRRELERNFKKQAEKAARQISESTKRQMQRVIDRGNEKGESVIEIQDKLEKKIGVNGRRAQIISEVEIGSVTAEGRDKLSRKIYDKNTRKVWVTTRDSKVRDPHQYAEGQTVGINEDFVIHGKRTERIPYPRYRGASAWNRCNCRCRLLYLKEGE